MFGALKVVAASGVNYGPRRLGPIATSIDYVHTVFMGSHKLSSFDSHRVG
jgi:hypothetical protein